jgi:hypothetical protein
VGVDGAASGLTPALAALPGLEAGAGLASAGLFVASLGQQLGQHGVAGLRRLLVGADAAAASAVAAAVAALGNGEEEVAGEEDGAEAAEEGGVAEAGGAAGERRDKEDELGAEAQARPAAAARYDDGSGMALVAGDTEGAVRAASGDGASVAVAVAARDGSAAGADAATASATSAAVPAPSGEVTQAI